MEYFGETNELDNFMRFEVEKLTIGHDWRILLTMTKGGSKKGEKRPSSPSLELMKIVKKGPNCNETPSNTLNSNEKTPKRPKFYQK